MTKSKYDTGVIVHVQSVMHQGKINALKKKTGQESTKDALVVAVDAYLDSEKQQVIETEV